MFEFLKEIFYYPFCKGGLPPHVYKAWEKDWAEWQKMTQEERDATGRESFYC